MYELVCCLSGGNCSYIVRLSVRDLHGPTVKEGDVYVTHIYQSRECFRLDELARYRRKAFKTLEVTASKSTVEKEKIKDS